MHIWLRSASLQESIPQRFTTVHETCCNVSWNNGYKLNVVHSLRAWKYILVAFQHIESQKQLLKNQMLLGLWNRISANVFWLFDAKKGSTAGIWALIMNGTGNISIQLRAKFYDINLQYLCVTVDEDMALLTHSAWFRSWSPKTYFIPVRSRRSVMLIKQFHVCTLCTENFCAFYVQLSPICSFPCLK